VIVLDTSVISELTRPVPEPGVISWLDSLPARETAITAITAAELLYGARRPPGVIRPSHWGKQGRGRHHVPAEMFRADRAFRI
jgi:predicted nucleic acid-binding protein